MSEALKGKTRSLETRKKMSEAQKGKKHPFYGKHHSEETKRKMVLAWRRRKQRDAAK